MASGNEITRDTNSIVRERQRSIRRELDRRGISLKAVAYDSGIPYPTVVSYFTNEKDKEPATVSGAAIFSLCGALPADLLSLLLPDGFQIVRAPEAIDHDEIAAALHDYLQTKERAHHPESPAGRDIAECEDNVLRATFARIPGKAA